MKLKFKHQPYQMPAVESKLALERQQALFDQQADLGFRVLNIDSSNMKDVYYAPDQVRQADLFDHVDNIKSDRTPEDLLLQVLLDWGVDLGLPIAAETLAGRQVFFVGHGCARRLLRDRRR